MITSTTEIQTNEDVNTSSNLIYLIHSLANADRNPFNEYFTNEYLQIFNILKLVLHGKRGLVNLLKTPELNEDNGVVVQGNSNALEGTQETNENLEATTIVDDSKDSTTVSVNDFLEGEYSNLILTQKKPFTAYFESASKGLYSGVLGQERIVLSNIYDNLKTYKKHNEKIIQQINGELLNIESNILINSKKNPSKNKDKTSNKLNGRRILLEAFKMDYLNLISITNQILSIIDKGTEGEKAFLYTMLGKVMEGSLSQARKSKGGNLAEKIVEKFLSKQGLNVIPQVKDGATNTDLVVRTNNASHYIAVQLSTNDRIRLSTDEYGKDSTNYLVSLNGCEVSTKNINDISFQRMSKWMQECLEDSKKMPYYVGIKPFVETVRTSYTKSLHDVLVSLNLAFNIDFQEIALKSKYLELINLIKSRNLDSKLEEKLKEKFYLFAWAKFYTLSFEDLVEKINEG